MTRNINSLPLADQRTILALNIEGSYSPDDFPGSRRWTICKGHQDALDAFDAAHPEIIAAIRAEEKAAADEIAKNAGWI